MRDRDLVRHTGPVPTAHLLAFVAASLLLVVIPGPSLLFTIGRALSAGRRAALLTVVGNATGLAAQVTLVALGLGALVSASATVFTVVKFVGAAYLLYLGVEAIRTRRDGLVDGLVPHTSISTLTAVRTGFVVGVTNPKTIVFLAALLPQFLDRSAAAPQSLQMLLLGAVFVVVALLGDATIAYAAGTLRAWFATSPRRMARLRGTGGVMICGLGVGVAFAQSGS